MCHIICNFVYYNRKHIYHLLNYNISLLVMLCVCPALSRFVQNWKRKFTDLSLKGTKKKYEIQA
jgi:hypothetical protein